MHTESFKGSKVARSVKSNTDKGVTPDLANLQEAAAGADAGVDLPQTDLISTPGQEPEVASMPEPEMDQSPDPAPFDPIEPAHLPPPEKGAVPDRSARKSGIGPLVIGGIVAAALGYAAAYFGQIGQTAELTAKMSAQTDRVAALEAQLTALPAPVDLAQLNATISELQADLIAGQSEAAALLAGLEARLGELEKAPNADGTLSTTAIDAWAQELETLRAEITAERSRMQDLVDAATAQLDQTRVAAAEIELTATESTAALTARAALTRIQAALDSGTPFDAALGDLSASVEVPAALTAMARNGVPTMSTLQADFPDAARAALAIARSEGLAGEDGGGIAAFLRNQFDVRSVTAQEGATVDAILSRAEEDLRQNHLSDAMAEVATLPEVVRAEMSGWISAAETRTAATSAVEGLSEILTQN